MLNVQESAEPVACWYCSEVNNPSALFCASCSRIQPESGCDYFSVFGIEPRFNIDLVALEQEFHRLSRKLHPDRYARASEREKQWSLANAALLNDAYRTLRDPLLRTEYLLKLRGANIGEPHSSDNGRDTSRAPADLLEEIFELNMELEEMRSAHRNPETENNLLEAEKRFEHLVREADKSLRAQWTAWDNGDETARRAAEKQMLALLDRRRYINNLVRELKAAPVTER